MGVLFRYGFGYLLYELKLGEHLPLLNRFVKKREEARPLSFGERLRLAFEELGPTFIKFGQLLSNRVDLIPPEVIRELTKLQDHAPAFPSDTARRIIGEELGRSPQELFLEFAAQPIAAASIAQVHQAVLPSGEKVVVKVQRPDIHKEVNLGHVINETIYIAARYRIKMPPDCVLLGKAIVTKSKRDKKRGVSWCVETRNRNKTPSASFPLCKNHDAFVTLCEPVAP